MKTGGCGKRELAHPPVVSVDIIDGRRYSELR